MAPIPQVAPELTHPSGARAAVLAAAVVGVVVAATTAGAAWDILRGESERKGRPRSLPGWAVGMLVSSYALLIPGLVAHLFVARTDFMFWGAAWPVSKYDETMVSLVGRLAHDQMYTGAAMVVLYAIAIPLLKIALLIAGRALRHGGPDSIRRARFCISVVQAISKWACPDMFAYILLMCLMRGLNKPPTLLSDLTLDLGFTCFSVFCVASTVSSLGIRLPELPQEAQPEQRLGGCDGSVWQRVVVPSAAVLVFPRGCTRCVGRCAAAVAVDLLAAVFLCALVVGLARPSMSLQMDMPLLYQVRPELRDMAPVIESLHLDDLLHQEVSVWQCIVSLAGWVYEGEVNALIALILYAGFAVLLPFVDMALLVIVVLADLRPGSHLASSALALSQKLRKLSMLDVSVMGSLVVVLSLASLRSMGVIVSVRSGVAALLVAELSRYTAAAIVRCAHCGEPCLEEKPLERKSTQASTEASEGTANADDSDCV